MKSILRSSQVLKGIGRGGVKALVEVTLNDVYFKGDHFHSSSSTLREERSKRDHAWKHLYLVPLFEFHDTRHFVEFVLNFKVSYSKGISKWGLRLPCISKGSSKEAKGGQNLDRIALKTVKQCVGHFTRKLTQFGQSFLASFGGHNFLHASPYSSLRNDLSNKTNPD